ncbi:flagellar basal body protein [Luminiphilus sp.]|nr:flagellar basal body protein [Luminiphilus sp.]
MATLLLYFPLALGMSLSTLNNALSGLQAATAKMQVTANNVANARTDGYQTQRVDILERPGGVEARIPADTPRARPAPPPTEAAQGARAPSNVDLAQEMVKMTANESFYLANVRALEAAHGMLGTLLDTEA